MMVTRLCLRRSSSNRLRLSCSLALIFMFHFFKILLDRQLFGEERFWMAAEAFSELGALGSGSVCSECYIHDYDE